MAELLLTVPRRALCSRVDGSVGRSRVLDARGLRTDPLLAPGALLLSLVVETAAGGLLRRVRDHRGAVRADLALPGGRLGRAVRSVPRAPARRSGAQSPHARRRLLVGLRPDAAEIFPLGGAAAGSDAASPRRLGAVSLRPPPGLHRPRPDRRRGIPGQRENGAPGGGRADFA